MCIGHVLYAIFRCPPESCRPVPTLPPLKDRTYSKLLCYINTYPPMYEKKAIHVQNTWARRCDKFFFTSTVPHPNLSVLLLNLTVSEVRGHLWVKFRQILRKIYPMVDEYDYFFKADDDTYTVVENLRASLWEHSPEDAFLSGYRWNAISPGGYYSGGAGYLLSRKAFKRIVEQAIDKHPKCPTTDENMEDVKISVCGRAVGVHLIDKFGETGTSLYYPYSINQHFEWQWVTGCSTKFHFRPECPYMRRAHMAFSSRHITFHYMEPAMMYIVEFLQYFMNPHAPGPS